MTKCYSYYSLALRCHNHAIQIEFEFGKSPINFPFPVFQIRNFKLDTKSRGRRSITEVWLNKGHFLLDSSNTLHCGYVLLFGPLVLHSKCNRTLGHQKNTKSASWSRVTVKTPLLQAYRTVAGKQLRLHTLSTGACVLTQTPEESSLSALVPWDKSPSPEAPWGPHSAGLMVWGWTRGSSTRVLGCKRTALGLHSKPSYELSSSLALLPSCSKMCFTLITFQMIIIWGYMSFKIEYKS